MPSREIPEDERIYIREASEMLDRRIGTLRKWEAMGVLPQQLRPRRGKRGWRYWTAKQIEGIKKWIERTDRRPGVGLPHIKANPELAQKQIHAMRRPRKKRTQSERSTVNG